MWILSFVLGCIGLVSLALVIGFIRGFMQAEVFSIMITVIFVVLFIALGANFLADIAIKIKKKRNEKEEKKEEPIKEEKPKFSPGILSTEDLEKGEYIAKEFKRKWPWLLAYLQREGDTVTYQFRNSNPYNLRIVFMNSNNRVSSYYIDTEYNPANGQFKFVSEGIHQVGNSYPRDFLYSRFTKRN